MNDTSRFLFILHKSFASYLRFSWGETTLSCYTNFWRLCFGKADLSWYKKKTSFGENSNMIWVFQCCIIYSQCSWSFLGTSGRETFIYFAEETWIQFLDKGQKGFPQRRVRFWGPTHRKLSPKTRTKEGQKSTYKKDRCTPEEIAKPFSADMMSLRELLELVNGQERGVACCNSRRSKRIGYV